MPFTTATISDRDPHHPELTAEDGIAAAIAAGKDLGVFELCSAVAKARDAIPLGGSPRTDAATRAVVAIRVAFDRVATTIYSADIPQAICPCCDLREQLDELIDVAVRAVAHAPDRRPIQGRKTIKPGGLLEACEDLARYAGDDHPDADATQTVLELARDVFTWAVAELNRK
jgi:hypothetical protein